MSDPRKRFLLRGGLVAGLVVLLVGAMLTPSIGGSFLTKQKANKTFIKKKAANNTFLKKAEAESTFLKQTEGVTTAVASSTALPGFQSTSITEVPIPGAETSITVPPGQNAILVVTFNATSLCTHATAGFNCPIRLLVDGQPANPTPDPSGYLFDTTVVAANSKNRALSVTASKSVGPGAHTVEVTYGGGVVTTTFTLRTWHLMAQAFPA